MKNILKVIALLVIIATLFSCKKNKTKYTISGNIYYNCEKLVAANRSFVLLQKGYGGGIIDSFKTDASGYFSIQYHRLNSAEVILAQRQNIGVGEFGVFKAGKNYEGIKIYADRTCTLRVRISVINNSYTNKDTLYLGDFRRTAPPYRIAIPGPFVSGEVYKVDNYLIGNYVFGFGNGTPLARITNINNVSKEYGFTDLVPCTEADHVIEIR